MVSSQKRELVISILLVVLAIVLSCIAFFNWKSPGQPAIEYRMPKLDANAVKITDDVIVPGSSNPDVILDEPEEGGGVSHMTYSDLVNVDLSDKTAKFVFQNNEGSSADLIVQLEVGDKVLGSTGRVRSGYAAAIIENCDVTGLLSGEYDGVLRASYYDAVTGEKAIVDVTVEVRVIVVD